MTSILFGRYVPHQGDEVDTWGKVTKQESAGPKSLLTCAVGLKKRKDGQEIISGTATVKIAL